MTHEALLQAGSVGRVSRLLKECGARSVFLVTGGESYATCGAEQALAPALGRRRTCRFSDFDQNPKLADAERGLQLFRREDPDVVLAVGGGSVIDMAKLIAFFADQEASPRDVIEGRGPLRAQRRPLIAVPTTAGTGSEATHFAVVYVDGRKHSVAHPSIMPRYAVVDADLASTLPPRLTAVTGLDALSQAIESLWSVNSTARSQEYAREAVSLIGEHLPDCVRQPTPAARRALARGAYLAGSAINLTKTTAPHAISYTMTSRFGVPHGHAVALTLGETLVFNSQVTDLDVTDPRGVDHVRRTIAYINRLLGCATAEESSMRLRRLMDEMGIETRLRDVGIRSDAQRAAIAENVNTERLVNNPRSMTGEQLRGILQRAA